MNFKPALKILQIRSGYINQRTLYASLLNRFSGKKHTVMPGYLPPEVKYINEDGEMTASVRDYDVTVLRDLDESGALEYLNSILKAASGDKDFQYKLKMKLEQIYSEMHPIFHDIEISEDEYLIPCTSDFNYNEELVSNKGFNLLHLIQEGFPVPDFTILSSRVYSLSKQDHEKKMSEAIEVMEKLTGLEYGASENPLLIAMRCAMPIYIPGVMPTFLNIGVTENNIPSLVRLYGNEAASRIVLTNLKTILMELDSTEYEIFEKEIRPDLDMATNNQLSLRLASAIKKNDPLILTDPFYQILFFLSRAYKDYENHLDFLQLFIRGKVHYPAIILQKMVCSALNDFSYAGILMSKNPQTGKGRQFQIARAVFGEEIMTGRIVTIEEVNFAERQDIEYNFPAVYHFTPQLQEIEKFFFSPVTIEFAAENGLFALLQANQSELTGNGMIVSVMDLYRSGIIDISRVIELIKPYHIRQLESDAIDQESLNELKQFSRGTSILPRSVVSGKIYFSSREAEKAKDRGETTILAKETFIPSDASVMQKSDGIISLSNIAIHVVTTSQGLGIPALINLEKYGVQLTPNHSLINAQGDEIREGDFVTISSRHQLLFLGKARFTPARLSRYMTGESVEIADSEIEYFKILANDYAEYKKLIENISTSSIGNIHDLFQLIKFEYKEDEEKKYLIVNKWFDDDVNRYIDEVFKAELGFHLTHQTIYSLLSTNRRIKLMKALVEKSRIERLNGYKAGCFVLGLFVNNPHSIFFWESFIPSEIALMLNEWILYQKYIEILHKVGERNISKARDLLLTQELPSIRIHKGNVTLHIALKLSKTDLNEVRLAQIDEKDPQFDELLELLLKPFSYFYDYGTKWSIRKLEKICQENSVSVPGPEDI